MFKFQVFDDQGPATQYPLRNAYLLGSDLSAMRGGVTFDPAGHQVACDKKESGSASLAIQQPVGDCGELTLQTCLLPDRDDAYLLLLELARHRLMTLYSKFEDWGMYEAISDSAIQRRTETARKLFIEALCHQHDDPVQSAKLAGESLAVAIDGSEELALAHADLLLNRRKASGMLPRQPFGCGLPPHLTHDRLRGAVAAGFDFLNLPAPWKMLTPHEAGYRWELLDNWVEWAAQAKLPLTVGPLINFHPRHLPEWMFIWEHDYETVRDLVYEHLERVVSRYKDHVQTWNIVSGLHINSHFTFSFDQVMDLTRMCAVLVKKIQPQANVLIELREPFGEYFATNQRSLPPLMYADLLVQASVPFDGFVVKMLMGQSVSGQHVRDLMQISDLLDHFAPFGKPINLVTAVPSEPVTQEMIALETHEESVDPHSGVWRKPWSPVVQSHWMEAMYKIAISKPYIESVAWHEMVDHPDMELPLSGLIGEDMAPKSTFRRLVNFRRNLLGTTSASAVTPASEISPPEAQASEVSSPEESQVAEPSIQEVLSEASALPSSIEVAEAAVEGEDENSITQATTGPVDQQVDQDDEA